MFSKILIANRGEIACRVIRTARRLGVRTVAVFSDADRDALHVALADEAIAIGPARVEESYLRGERILEAARRCGAEAIHPGYGFLAENADFAAACERAGIVFVGPSAAAIRAIGDKAAAKRLMEKAGVPLLPGYHGERQDEALLAREAQRIGWPVVIKAAAGGGGKGMRVVRRAQEFAAALDASRREAKSAFGDERVILERYLEHPRHIEIQVFADRHGNFLHLFERDCSLQRRHQKVIEEAPAPAMSEERRRRMGEAAIAAARAVDYTNAGTVEFIVAPDGDFRFIEMNTRLQVEHPVTEMITGLDLVEWQLRVAAGEPLPLAQEALSIRGHAIEARLYAEDPARDFLPATGRITHLSLPQQSDHLRVDAGVRAGDIITPWYDPMIAKLIVHGAERAQALARLCAALEEFEIAGPANNRDFLLRLARCRPFTEGEVDTGLIERHRAELLALAPPADEWAVALAAAAFLAEQAQQAKERAQASADPHSPWQLNDGWRIAGEAEQLVALREGGREIEARIGFRRGGRELRLGKGAWAFEYRDAGDARFIVRLGDRSKTGRAVRSGKKIEVFLAGEHVSFERFDPLERETSAFVHPGSLSAPMPGRVTAVLTAAGARVEKGTPLLVLEAMKMEHTLVAPTRGQVKALRCAAGEQVAEGAELIEFEPEEQ